jgi:hypothetical protein
MKHKKMIALLACLSVAAICFAYGTGSETIVSVKYEPPYNDPIVGPVDATYYVLLRNVQPSNLATRYSTESNISSWSAGDSVSVVGFPFGTSPRCPAKSTTDTILTDTTRNQWVCAMSLGSF